MNVAPLSGPSGLRRLFVLTLVLLFAPSGVLAGEGLPVINGRDLAPVISGGLMADEVADAVRLNSPSVSAAELELRAAEAQIVAARVMAIPRLDLTAAYTRLSAIDSPPLSFGGMEIPSPFPVILDNYMFRASLVVPLSDIFLKALPGLQIVNRLVDSREQQLRANAIIATWQGREVYYGWLKAYTARNVAQASVEILEATVGNLQHLVDAGVVPRIDQIMVEAGLEQARTGVAQAEVGIVMASNAIRILTGWNMGGDFAPGEDLLETPLTPAPTPEDLVDQALRDRPEISLFAQLLNISDSRIRIQKSYGWPSLYVTGNFLYANPNQRIVPSSEQFDATWDVGVSIAWSPNDIWSTRASVDQAEIERAQIRDNVRAFEIGLRNDASQAVAQWNAALTAIRGAQVQLQAARTEFEARQIALEGGVGTTTDLLSSQGRLVSAWMDLLSGMIDLRRAMALADRVVGVGGSLQGIR